MCVFEIFHEHVAWRQESTHKRVLKYKLEKKKCVKEDLRTTAV